LNRKGIRTRKHPPTGVSTEKGVLQGVLIRDTHLREDGGQRRIIGGK